MKFIQDLNESRLYRKLSQLSSKSTSDLAERLFEHLLALQILAQENPQLAARYAQQIAKYQNFEGFRTSQNDLYNLISVMLNTDKYSYIINDDKKYTIPELRLKRNLRELARGNYNDRDYSELMMMLQRQFDQLKGQHIALRRSINDWANQNSNEKRIIIRRMLINMRERGIQSDLYVVLEKLL